MNRFGTSRTLPPKIDCQQTLVQNAGMEGCAEAVSAVKAVQIAASQGQKVYTITPQNGATALPKLTAGGPAGDEIRNEIQAGMEVTFYEKGINAFGWSGVDSIVDPNTGGESYLIEGNGSYLVGVYLGLAITSYIMTMLAAQTGIGGVIFIELF